jgi:hypothetical protein
VNPTVPYPSILPKVRRKDRKVKIYIFDKIELVDKGNDVVLLFAPKLCVHDV